MPHPLIAQLLRVYDQAFHSPSWHGTPLRGAIRGLSARDALRRPGRGRHNVWEVVLHTAYWKYIVRRRLTRDETATFPIEGSNWFAVREPGAGSRERKWKAAVRLLDQQHALLRRVIARFPAPKLKRRGWRSKWTNEQHIYGIASHDLYHAGQIQLIKRFVRANA